MDISHKNYSQVHPGDLVIGYQSTPVKRIVALATVSKGLHTNERDERVINLAPLRQVSHGATYEDLKNDDVMKLSEPMRNSCRGTLFALTEDEAEYLQELLIAAEPDLKDVFDHALGEDGSVGQLIGDLEWVTFHPSYTYEDFIEGFRPGQISGGGLSLRLEDGIFKRMCLRALANPDRRYLMVIDEINRANLAKVFGELLTLLERDKRGLEITLPQSKESFSVPQNVHLLATMNTADRSIKLMDTALRRRFSFVELMPDTELLKGVEIGQLKLDKFLLALNCRIVANEGRDKQIGQAYLLEGTSAVSDPDEFARRFRQDILPLLQEYCYDDYAKLERYLGSELIDAGTSKLHLKVVENTDKLIAALARCILQGEEG